MSNEAGDGRRPGRGQPIPQGADLLPDGEGVRYRIWAPQSRKAIVAILEDADEDDVVREVALRREKDGYFSGVDPNGCAGDLYKFSLDGGELLPDPFSCWQPGDPFSASMVIDHSSYEWRADEWRRVPLLESVIYELHIGAFTIEGTFRAAIEKLDYLVDLGVTTVELMPLAGFPGSRNWGYDGVMLFAPDSSYGHPDDLRALIDAIHRRGLNVILDVVYNHFGPDGNFLTKFSPFYFDETQHTPWGSAINFGGPHSRHVRSIYLANIAYWMDEFRFDGFRLDATHAILDRSTPHILCELARVAHERHGLIIAEDDRNLADLALPPKRGGMGLDALWADDFHHTTRVALTGEREAYLGDFTGAQDEVARTLNEGWLYSGQDSSVFKKPRGTPAGELSCEQFVHCISNHDQVGNRALGERLHHFVSPESYRAASVLCCLTPCVPLLFMGQEWAASSPFLYFTDHQDELGEHVTAGRRKEFSEFFSASGGSAEGVEIPDPQEEKTFQRSKLDWVERGNPDRAGILALYTEALSIRARHPAIIKRNRDNFRASVVGNGIVALRFRESAHCGLLLLVDLKGGHEVTLSDEKGMRLPSGWRWALTFSSNEERFGGDGPALEEKSGRAIRFTKPEAAVFETVEEI